MSEAPSSTRRRGVALARAVGLGDASGPRGGVAATAEGAALMVASTFFLAGSNAMVKTLTPEIHPFVSGFILNLVGLLTVWPWLRREGWGVLRMKAPGLHLLRGLIGAGTLMAWMWALAEIELAKATALSFTAPLFATAAAGLLLGERVSRPRWIALLVGFAGTLVILRPGFVAIDLGTGGRDARGGRDGGDVPYDEDAVGVGIHRLGDGQHGGGDDAADLPDGHSGA